MTLNQVIYFLLVSDVGSFSAAAEKLYVSQPAVSKQIALLEKSLGFKLFHREDRRVSLTLEGEIMRECFHRCEEDFERTIGRIRQFGDGEPQVIYLGVMSQWNIAKHISPVIERFRELYPNTRLEMELYNFKDIMTALLDHEVDMLLGHKFLFANSSETSSVEVCSLKSGILYSEKHFSQAPGTELPHFSEAPLLISGDAPMSFQKFLYYTGERYGLSQEKRFFKREASTLLGAMGGQGIMLTSEWNIGNSSKGLRFIPRDRDMPISIGCLAEHCDMRKWDLMRKLAEIIREVEFQSGSCDKEERS